MVRTGGNHSLEALAAIDAFVEDGPVRVKNIKDSICVHLLTRSVDADLEMRGGPPQQLLKVGSAEHSDLNHGSLVLEAGVEVGACIRAIDLINFNVDSSGCVNQCFVHIEQEETFARLKLNVHGFQARQVTREIALLEVCHINKVLNVLKD